MSKINQNSKTKLFNMEIPTPSTTGGIVIPDKISLGSKNKSTKPQSFSLKNADSLRLKRLIDDIQELSDRRITSTDIIRGLLILGEESKKYYLFKCVQKGLLE